MMPGHWGFGWWGLLTMLLFWGAVIVVVALAIRAWRPPAPPEPPDPRRILAERFARGEISAEEFEERRRVLDGHHG